MTFTTNLKLAETLENVILQEAEKEHGIFL